MNKVLVITGPTASGKSALAIEVAKKINGVIISADSMQIYKGLDIGTAKVDEKEAQGIEHTLIDICDLTDKFDVSTYKKLCYEKIDEILSQNKVPIIVGGTGLYINSVVNNINFEAERTVSQDIQEKIYQLNKDKTADELYKYLQEIDELSAKFVDSHNKRRILRAIELKLSGTSKFEQDNKNKLWNKNESKYDFFTVYIDIPRSLLYDRIERRIDEMVKCGVLQEAQKVYDIKDTNCTATQAIGYKEFFGFFDGTMSLNECVNNLKLNTRHYAKRQITWFKKLEDKYIVDGTKPLKCLVDNICNEFCQYIESKK